MVIIPKVSVVMSIYNGQNYLNEAIDSILNQKFIDFEFIIIDDGSTDNSAEIIRRYKDSRIVFIQQENRGLMAALNVGINAAQGKYIARMDQDDISLPERLEKQVHYLDTNPHICVVGSWWKNINENNAFLGYTRVPVHDYECAFMMFEKGENPVGHPCVLYRTAAIRMLGGYSPEYKNAEDVELWFRLNAHGFQIANIPEALILYRIHNRQMSKTPQTVIEHHYALSRFLSDQLSQNVESHIAALIRPANFNNAHFQNKCQLEQMLLLKRQSIQIFLDKYNLPNNQLFSCVMVLWESLLPLCQLKIVNIGGMFAGSLKFCLEILSSNWKNQKGIDYRFHVLLFIVSSFIVVLRKIAYRLIVIFKRCTMLSVRLVSNFRRKR